MYQLLAKKGQLFAIVLGVVVCAIFLGSVLSGLSSGGYSLGDDLNQIMKNNPDQTFDFFNIGLWLTAALIIIALVIAVIFGLWQLISAPKQSMKGIIGVAIIAVLFFALYSSAATDADSVIKPVLDKFFITDNLSKLIGGGIMTTAILAGVAAASLVLFEIYNLFK